MTEQQAAIEEELAPQEPQAEPQEPKKEEDPWSTFQKPEGFDEKYVEIDRFNKVYGKMKHFERELQTKQEPHKEEKPQPQGNRPDRINYETQEAYEDAVTDWHIEQREQKSIQAQRQQTLQQRNAAFDQKMAKGFSKYPDFEQVVYADTTPLSQITVEVLKDFDNPDDVAYFLSKNTNLAVKLYSLTNPITIARELTKIETELSKPKPRTQTQAPEPAETIGDKDTPLKKLEDMSYEDYRDYQNRKQFGKK